MWWIYRYFCGRIKAGITHNRFIDCIDSNPDQSTRQCNLYLVGWNWILVQLDEVQANYKIPRL